MQLTGSDIIVECLLEQGADTVFGYPGGAVLNIYDSLYKYSDRIHHVITSHEQGACHAADGYARATGRTGVVIATSGPGATNLTTGIATAYMDSIPLVAITGNVSCDLLGLDSFQEVDITGITMPVTKHNFIVKDVTELADTLRLAFKIAGSGRKGPVLVDIPKDITAAKCEHTPQPPVVPDAPPALDSAELSRAAELIDKISGMAGGFDRAQLRRNVLVAGRKCIDAALGNTVLYNVDRINEAIIQKKKITFQYYSYDARKRRVKRGGLRTVSPYDLVWNDEQYYLRGYFEDGERPGIRNFRVDRIDELHVLDERAIPRPKGYSVSECVTQAFSMFNAQSVEVLMRFSDPKWMNAVVDRFGTNVRVTETNGTSFTIRTKLQPSAPFYGWLFQFGAEAEIISPHDVREEYERRVRELCEKINRRKKNR